MQQRLDEPGAGRIAIENRQEIGPECLRDAGVVSHDFGEGLAEQEARNVAVVETRRDPIDHGRLQAVMVQDRGEHQLGKNGLTSQDLVRLAPHPGEQGIGVRYVDHLGGLTLSHDPVSQPRGPNLAPRCAAGTRAYTMSPLGDTAPCATTSEDHRYGASPSAQAPHLRDVGRSTRPQREGRSRHRATAVTPVRPGRRERPL